MNSKYKNKINEAIKNIEKLEKVQVNRKYRIRQCEEMQKYYEAYECQRIKMG